MFMSIHKNRTSENPVCYSCEAFISGLSYVMQDFVLWVFKNYPTCHIAQGWRSEDQQHADFLDGKSQLDWPRSPHNNQELGRPFSEAVDLFFLDEHGKALFPVDKYQELNNQVQLSGHKVDWGGDFPTFKDSDHWQNSSWMSPKEN